MILDGNAATTTFHITNLGGYYYSMITYQSNPQIGDNFQNQCWILSVMLLESIMMFAYIFPNDTYIYDLGSLWSGVVQCNYSNSMMVSISLPSIMQSCMAQDRMGSSKGECFWRTPSHLVATLLPITLAANDKTAAAVENYDGCYLQGWVP